jgi:hypothetical protein
MFETLIVGNENEIILKNSLNIIENQRLNKDLEDENNSAEVPITPNDHEVVSLGGSTSSYDQDLECIK